MSDKYQFIFIAPQNDLEIRFYDLKQDKRVTYIEGSGRKINNPILLFIKRIHLSIRINKYISLPFKSIWGCNLDKVDWKDDITYYIVVSQGSLWPIKLSYLTQLKEKYNIKFAIILYDYWDSKYSEIAKYYVERFKFDYIFSFDPNDCKKYGFTNVLQFFHEYRFPVSDIKYDLYYTGVAKERLNVLHRVFCAGIENKAILNFKITEVKKKNKLDKGNIIYNKKISYKKVLEEIQECNCILETLTPRQSGATLRYCEAVCYNKKLLTNNKNVVNLPFYNPDYIHVFEKPEDIDWAWVKGRIPVDYHYDGRFSPTHFIDKIIELEENKKYKLFGGNKKIK